jgi:hypothetical protein
MLAEPCVDRWLTVRIDFLSGLFCAGLAAFLVYGPYSVNPSNIGLTLTTAAIFCQSVLYWIQCFNKMQGKYDKPRSRYQEFMLVAGSGV